MPAATKARKATSKRPSSADSSVERLNEALKSAADTAQAVRKDLGHGAHDLIGDVETLIHSARKDVEKLARTIRRDLERPNGNPPAAARKRAPSRAKRTKAKTTRPA